MILAGDLRVDTGGLSWAAPPLCSRSGRIRANYIQIKPDITDQEYSIAGRSKPI